MKYICIMLHKLKLPRCTPRSDRLVQERCLLILLGPVGFDSRPAEGIIEIDRSLPGIILKYENYDLPK